MLCVASSGIAAILLPHGQTAHSRFRIPITLDHDSTSSITRESTLGINPRQIHLIIGDEVPLQHWHCFEVVNRLMQDLHQSKRSLSGVPALLGGDFAPILSVVKGTGKGHGDIVAACLQRSYLWNKLTIL